MANRFFSFKHTILLLLFLAAVPLTAFAGELPQPKIGEAAPLFTLEDLQGGKVALAELQGKFVVIHFATSWRRLRILKPSGKITGTKMSRFSSLMFWRVKKRLPDGPRKEALRSRSCWIPMARWRPDMRLPTCCRISHARK